MTKASEELLRQCEWEHWRTSEQWKRGECFLATARVICASCSLTLANKATPHG